MFHLLLKKKFINFYSWSVNVIVDPTVVASLCRWAYMHTVLFIRAHQCGSELWNMPLHIIIIVYMSCGKYTTCLAACYGAQLIKVVPFPSWEDPASSTDR